MPMGDSLSAPQLEVLLTSGQIAARVRELAALISSDYQGRTPHLVGVLKGAWIFLADLIRHLTVQSSVDFLGLESYADGTTSSGEVKITRDLDASIAGRDVLVVEDILDTGRTYLYLQDLLTARRPRSVKLAVLLDKASRRRVPVQADYVGFEIPDVFVVGYGLDYKQQFRGLPDLRYLPGSGGG